MAFGTFKEVHGFVERTELPMDVTRARARLSTSRIQAAVSLINPIFLNTPQFSVAPLGAELGCEVLAKIETLNPVRSFKGRGAELFMSKFAASEATSTVVCASAGNFGQAMAFAADTRGIRLIVYAATTANSLKVRRMRDFGAEVRLGGDDFDAAKLSAKRFAGESGFRLVEDSLDPETAEGAGTIGLEILALDKPLDVLLVPIGNGALFNGIARVLKDHAVPTRRVGVQASGAPAMVESLRTGRIVSHERVSTIADGIAVRVPIPEALHDMEGLVDDTVLVGDDEIVRGMRLIHEHIGVVPEPSAAVGVAAVLAQPERYAGQRIGIIVCGGNLTPEQMARWLG